MSADTTVIILETRSPEGAREFRVKMIQNAELLYLPGSSEEEPKMNKPFIYGYFSDCEVITDLETAEDVAEGIEEEWEHLCEYGTDYVDAFAQEPFPTPEEAVAA